MAQIELRHATLRLVDGYSNTALVNGSPVNGDSVVNIDSVGTPTKINLGTRFTVVGNSSRPHYVTAQNANEVQQVPIIGASTGHFKLTFKGTVANVVTQQTGSIDVATVAANIIQTALEALVGIDPGDVTVTLVSGTTFNIEYKGQYANTDMTLITFQNIDLDAGGATPTQVYQGGFTHQITFTPTFTTADGVPADDAAITFSGNTLEINIGTGNLTYNEQRQMTYTLDRGVLDTVREGDDVPMDVVLDFIWEFINATAGDLTPSIEDAFKQRGNAVNWVSSSSDQCEPYAIDIEIEHVPPCNNEEIERLLFPDFRWESLNHNLRDATVAVTGKCNAKQAIVSRSAV